MSGQWDEISNAISQARQAVVDAEQQLVATVAQARRDGASWTLVGRVLGVSRQAAWERFASKIAQLETGGAAGV